MQTVIKCLVHDTKYMYSQDYLTKWIECNGKDFLGIHCPRPCQWEGCPILISEADMNRAWIFNNKLNQFQTLCKQHRLILLSKELEERK